MASVLVTGANRGIGLEFVRQYVEDGWRVIACCRDPRQAAALHALAAAADGRVTIEKLDVCDHAAVDALAQRLRGQPIDVLVNNAGIIGPRGSDLKRQQFGAMDYAAMEEVWRTNTVGPLKMIEALADHVAASSQKKVATISSTVGSIAERKLPFLSYASSKTAVNKLMSLAAEALRPRGITVLALCPGNINQKEVSHAESIAGLRRLIAAATLAQTGSFTRYTGETVAY